MRKILFSLILLPFFALSVQAQNPGDVISHNQNLNLTPEGLVGELGNLFGTEVPAEIYDLANSIHIGLKAHRVLYYTKDYHGNLVQASGLILYPKVDFKMSTLVYCHPTTDHRDNVPSNLKDINEYGFALPLIYALSGYIVFAPDYIGMGSGEGTYHPYVDFKTESGATLDFMKAANTVMNQLDVKRYDEYFIGGYSQGGHAVMSTLKANYEKGSPYQFKYAYPGAGPYDMSKTTIEKGVLQKTEYPNTAFLAYIVNTCHQNGFSQYSQSPAQIIAPAYVDLYQQRAIEQGGGLDWGPSVWRQMFQTSYVNQMSNNNSSLRNCLRGSDVYDWYNKTPTTLAHGSIDKTVHPDNSTKTQSTQRGYYPWWDLNKYKIEHQSLGPVDHTLGAIVHLLASLHKFNSLRAGGYFNQWAWLFTKGEVGTEHQFNSYIQPDLNFELSEIYSVKNIANSHLDRNPSLNIDYLKDLEDGVYMIYAKNEEGADVVMPFVKQTPEKVDESLFVRSEVDGILHFNSLPEDLLAIHVFDANQNLKISLDAETFYENQNSLDVSNLKWDDYTFEVVFSTNALQFDKKVGVLAESTDIQVYTQGKTIWIQSQADDIQEVQIYNIEGKLVWNTQVKNQSKIQSIHLPSGVYLVNINSKQSQKIIIK